VSDERRTAEHWVASRLREARRSRDRTLASVAEQIGVTGAHLSRLENGERQPSIGVLLELARVYQTTIGALLGEEPTLGHRLVRGGEAHTIESADGPYRLLGGLPGAALSAFRLRLPPGIRHPDYAQHTGEEWIYALDGPFEVDLGGDTLALETGDALQLDTRLPHRFANPGDRAVDVLVVSTPAATSYH
jgi:transcriptional regulator with XRE-family HTH domain